MNTIRTDTEILYEILVAPSPTPLSAAAMTARAVEIGKLVGLGEPSFPDGYPPLDVATWTVFFAQAWDGIPVHVGSIQLELLPDGTVGKFWQFIGPRAAKPARPLTKTQAEAVRLWATPPSAATLEWGITASTDGYRVIWCLTWSNPANSEAEVWVDATTGEILYRRLHL